MLSGASVAALVLTCFPLPQRDCQNYIQILLALNASHLFTCGTSAFSPTCTYIVSVHPSRQGPGESPHLIVRSPNTEVWARHLHASEDAFFYE